MQERVLLLHGIWLRSLTLTRLAQRLAEAGFAVEKLDYPAVVGGPDAGAEILARRIARRAGERVHLVGHSLGGILALEALRRAPSLVDGRVVCLGSPLAGSRTARALSAWPATRWITGRSREILCSGVGTCVPKTEVGVVAGVMPFGFGGFVTNLPKPHDGTVALDETRIDGLTDHCTVATTHTGLVWSAEAARQVVAFLRDGRFERSAG